MFAEIPNTEFEIAKIYAEIAGHEIAKIYAEIGVTHDVNDADSAKIRQMFACGRFAQVGEEAEASGSLAASGSAAPSGITTSHIKESIQCLRECIPSLREASSGADVADDVVRESIQRLREASRGAPASEAK